MLSKKQTAHWRPLELCSDAKFHYPLKYWVIEGQAVGVNRYSCPVECSSERFITYLPHWPHVEDLTIISQMLSLSFPPLPRPPHKNCNCGDENMSVTILTYVRLPKRCIIFRWFQNFINPPSKNVILYRLYLYTVQRQLILNRHWRAAPLFPTSFSHFSSWIVQTQKSNLL